MNFLADENFPFTSCKLLQDKGHLLRLAAIELKGNPDISLLKEAVEKEEIILTFDKDFGELIFSSRLTPPPGIILLRIQDFLPEEPALVILELLQNQSFIFTGFFTVINRHKTRQRKLLPLI